MNIISFDTEEWYIEKLIHGGRKERLSLLDSTLNQLLDLLDRFNIKATFFCLGQLAIEYPYVVTWISKRGHEIGCHSHNHKWLNQMTDAEVEEDTKEAISALEDLIGQKVKSYRAPAFSITQDNKRHLEILNKYGIENDCSIFPASRSFGGYKDFPYKRPCTFLLSNNREMHEFPICLGTILGKEIVFSGGGYFRLIPLSMVKKCMKSQDYNMFYLHLGDLIRVKSPIMSKEKYEEYYKESGTLKNRVMRCLKTNIGREGAWSKFDYLMKNAEFVSVETASNLINWKDAPQIQL